MSNILILHGPSQYEVRKAYSISEYLEKEVVHRLPVLAELSLIQKGTFVNYFSFISSPLENASLNSFISSRDGMETINLAIFLINLIDLHDKVLLLPCEEVVSNDNFVVAIGYALGKNKILGSLNFPGYDLPHWYKVGIKNTVSSRSDILKITQEL